MSQTTAFKMDNEQKWAWLREELRAGADADQSEFIELELQTILTDAKARGTEL